MRRAARVDRPHAEFVRLFRSLGAVVFDTSRVGGGFSDLVVIWRGEVMLVEVKDGAKAPSKRKLTKAQVDFHSEVAAAGSQVYVVETGADVLRLMNASEGA